MKWLAATVLLSVGVGCGAGERPDLPCLDAGEGAWQDSSFERVLSAVGRQPPVIQLDDGRLAQIGRIDAEGEVFANVWSLDSGEQVSMAKPSSEAFGTWLIKLDNGRLLRGGGSTVFAASGGSPVTEVESYDAAANAWEPVAGLPASSGSGFMHAVALSGGRALLVGGSGTPLLFDGVSWTERSGAPLEFRGDRPLALADGTVFLEGYVDADPGPVPQTSTAAPTWEVAFQFDPAADTWRRLDPVTARSMLVRLDDGGYALIAQGGDLPSGAERLDNRPAPQWAMGYSLEATLSASQLLFAVGNVSDGEGWEHQDHYNLRRQAEIFDRNSQSWTCAAPLPEGAGTYPEFQTPSSVPAMFSLPNGSVLHIDSHGVSRMLTFE